MPQAAASQAKNYGHDPYCDCRICRRLQRKEQEKAQKEKEGKAVVGKATRIKRQRTQHDWEPMHPVGGEFVLGDGVEGWFNKLYRVKVYRNSAGTH